MEAGGTHELAAVITGVLKLTMAHAAEVARLLLLAPYGIARSTFELDDLNPAVVVRQSHTPRSRQNGGIRRGSLGWPLQER